MSMDNDDWLMFGLWVVAVTLFVLPTLYLLKFSERESGACKERGGTLVRTDNGYVCAVLTPAP